MGDLGKNLIWIGLIVVAIGAFIHFASHGGHRLPFRIGRLPGDIEYHGNRTTVYFPIVTCIVVSVVITGLIWLIDALRK